MKYIENLKEEIKRLESRIEFSENEKKEYLEKIETLKSIAIELEMKVAIYEKQKVPTVHQRIKYFFTGKF